MPTTTYDLTTGGLPAGWSRIGVTAAAETWSGSGLSVALTAGQGYTVPVPAGDFTLDVAVTSDSASSGVMFGPWIIGASNTGTAHGLCGSWYHSPSGCLLLQMNSLGYGSNFQALGAGKPQPYRIRIRYEAATRKGYLSFSSTGGASWSIESTPLTMAVDAARVGFGQILGPSTTHVVTEVKVTDSVTAVTVAGEPFASAATARDGAPRIPVLVSGEAFASVATAREGVAQAEAPTPVLIAGESFASTVVGLDGGIFGAPTGTDTTNAASGRIREGVGTMTLTPPVAPVPPGLSYGHRVDKAVALPTPTLVNGRPT